MQNNPIYRTIKFILTVLCGTSLVVAARAQSTQQINPDDLPPGAKLQWSHSCEHHANQLIETLQIRGVSLQGYLLSLPSEKVDLLYGVKIPARWRTSQINRFRQAEHNPLGVDHNQLIEEAKQVVIEANRGLKDRLFREGPCMIGLEIEACKIVPHPKKPGLFKAKWSECALGVILDWKDSEPGTDKYFGKRGRWDPVRR